MTSNFAKLWKSRTDKIVFDDIARKLNILTIKDWGNVRIKEVIRLGGGSALSRYGGSLYNTLSFIYSGILTKKAFSSR